MKNNIRYILTLAVMLVCNITVWADGQVNITKLMGGTATDEGTVTANIVGGTCTLTITSPEHWGVRASDITVVKVLDTEYMESRGTSGQRRTSPNFDSDEIEVTGSGDTYQFTMPESPYDVNVTVDYEEIFTITFNSDGGSEVNAVEGFSGELVEAPANPTKDGYFFGGWQTTEEPITDVIFPMVIKEGKTLKAKWNNATGIHYTVEHYLANADNETYPDMPAVIDNMSGTTNQSTEAVAKSYEEYVTQPFSQKTIDANGTTVVKIYYLRTIYTITFDLDGGSGVDNITAPHGAAVAAPAVAPTKDGYVFAGWNQEFPETMPIGGMTITAKWVKLGDVNGDGAITAHDAALILQYVAHKITAQTKGFYVDAADVNNVGGVTAHDASLVLQYVANIISW